MENRADGLAVTKAGNLVGRQLAAWGCNRHMQWVVRQITEATGSLPSKAVIIDQMPT